MAKTKTSSELKLSVTRINVFLQCKLKYKFNYVDNLPKVANMAFKLGIACHAALEYAGTLYMKKNKFTEKDKKAIIDKYNEVAIKEGVDDLKLHAEGRQLVEKKINGEFAYGGNILALEQVFGMQGGVDVLTKDQVPLIGAIDRVEEYDDHTLVIVDYKTQSTAPTQDDVKADLQLSMYDLVASKLYPKYKRIILCLDLLKFEPLYTYRTPIEREAFENYLKTMHALMSDFNPSKDAKANLNIFCSWCDYKDYCDEYKNACKKADYKFLETGTLSDKELFDEWEQTKNVEKIISNRRRELSNVIMNKIRDGGLNLTNNGKELYIKQNSKTDYDINTVFNSIPVEDFVGLVSLNKSALMSYLESQDRSIKEAINTNTTTNFTAPFLDVRKIRKND